MSLTSCLEKAGAAISDADRSALLSEAQRLIDGGQTPESAARAAVDALIARVRTEGVRESGAAAQGLPVEAVRAMVKALVKTWRNAPEIKVIASMEDAPADVFDKYQRETKAATDAGTQPGDVKGFITPDGTVYVVAAAATDPISIFGTVAHEVLGHRGLRGLFGKRLNSILDAVADTRAAEVAAKAVAYGMATDTDASGAKRSARAILKAMVKEDRRSAAEEVLAEMAESMPNVKEAGLVKRAIRAVKAWLLENFPALRGVLKLSDGDIIANYIVPARDWIRRGDAARPRAAAVAARPLAAQRTAPAAKEATPSAAPSVKSKIKAAFATPPRPAVSPKVGLLDTPLRVLLEKSRALNVWRGAFNLVEMAGGYAAHRIAPDLTETIKAGVIDKYGLDNAVIDQRRAMNSAIMGGARQTMRLLDKMGTLTRAESSVLYRAATTSDPAEVDALIKDLRPDSRDALQEIKRLMRELGAEQVRLGNLDAETFKRNEWSYLHRSYKKYELAEKDDKKAAAARALRIKGDQYKTRGLVDQLTADDMAKWLPPAWRAQLAGSKVPEAWRGETFTRLESREKSPDPGTLGRLRDVVYWPAGEAIPDRYASYHADGATWELRDVKNGRAMMWRDFTESERRRMGEIDDIRYALVRTMQMSVQDTEVSKYFEWLAKGYAKELDQLPAGAEPMTDEERIKAKLTTFPKGSWVKVPDTKAEGTDVRKYGQLAGKYVPGPVWNDVRNVGGETFFSSPLGQAYDKLQNWWKISKTSLSPAVHTNNVISNFVFMNWADVQSTHLFKALSAIARMNRDDGAKALWEAYKTHGGDVGSYAFQELQKGELESLLKSLEDEVLAQNNLNGLLNLSAAIDLWKEGEKRQALAALGRGKLARSPVALADAMIKVYGAEDTVFRLAAFIKAKADGQTDEQAGRFAQESFLDYSINAPWITAIRKTVLPFVAFSYRAMPKLYDTVKNKPWKVLSLMIAMQALNYAGYAMSGGDEDKERALLPKEKGGNIWGYGSLGVTPKLIRMPWNDDQTAPVFLDIRRWIPVGDIADIEQSHSAIPMPQWMSIGGIPTLMAEFFSNTSLFTGKNIGKETDTAWERSVRTADWLYKAVMPNIPLPTVGALARTLGVDLDPGQLDTYAATGIMNAGTGVTDPFGRELSLAQAVLNAVGVKVGAYPEDVAMQRVSVETAAQRREIGATINAYARQRQRQGIDDETFDRRRDANVEKLRKLQQDTQKRPSP